MLESSIPETAVKDTSGRDMSAKDMPAPRRKWLWFGLSLVILAVVVLVLFAAEDNADVTLADTSTSAPIASVLEVAPAEATARISVFAELRPRWDAEIRAAVSGRITKVHDAALAGERVEAGTSLFSIEKTQYETAIAAAELSLEEAKLALWHAENGVTLARLQFERDGTAPPNELALKLPQLRIAERTLASAEAQLEAARRQLADTEVSAPFSGFIVRRMASLGQTVSAGEPLLHLSDDRQYELIVEMSEADWALMDHPIAGKKARLFHRDGTPLGEARIRQAGGFLDKDTRQRRIFLTVSEPANGILAGDFVRVEFAGRAIADTLSLPEAALSRAGHVWMVDAGDLLVRVEPDILFRTDSTLVIQAPEGSGPWRVAKTPLASFLPGQRVTLQEATR